VEIGTIEKLGVLIVGCVCRFLDVVFTLKAAVDEAGEGI
jgi:hypothetical protein